MECKYCQHPLEEGNSVCPNCGKDNAEIAEEVKMEEKQPEPVPAVPAPPQAPQTKSGITVSPGKLAVAIVAGVLVIAALVAAVLYSLGIRINFTKEGKENTDPTAVTTVPTTPTEPSVPATIPADGNPDDETCKGTYTVSDADAIAAQDVVVARVGDAELTNGQLQVYYWMKVQQYLQSGYGPDYTQPLDTQICMLTEEGITWQQFLLRSALEEWQYYQSISQASLAEGHAIPNDIRTYLDGLDDSLETDAVNQGLANAEELLAANVGRGSEIADYLYYMETYYQGATYIDAKFTAMQPTMEEMETYFVENEATLSQSGVTKDGVYVDVRHILVTPKNETGADFTEEEWETCRQQAQEILDAWAAGEATEESFAALATEKTEDPASQQTGGLYENVYVGQTVKPFEEWCFDESRQYGDTGLVKTTYGYHVMYFVKSTPIWEVTVKQEIRNNYASGLIEQANEAYPMTVDYSAVVLCYVDMLEWFA